MHLPLRKRGSARGALLHAPRRLLDDAADALRLAAELLDAALHLAGVALRLGQVLLQALAVRRHLGHRDMGLECLLELALLRVRLVQILDQLRIARIYIWHGCLLPVVCVERRPANMIGRRRAAKYALLDAHCAGFHTCEETPSRNFQSRCSGTPGPPPRRFVKTRWI